MGTQGGFSRVKKLPKIHPISLFLVQSPRLMSLLKINLLLNTPLRVRSKYKLERISIKEGSDYFFLKPASLLRL